MFRHTQIILMLTTMLALSVESGFLNGGFRKNNKTQGTPVHGHQVNSMRKLAEQRTLQSDVKNLLQHIENPRTVEKKKRTLIRQFTQIGYQLTTEELTLDIYSILHLYITKVSSLVKIELVDVEAKKEFQQLIFDRQDEKTVQTYQKRIIRELEQKLKGMTQYEQLSAFYIEFQQSVYMIKRLQEYVYIDGIAITTKEYNKINNLVTSLIIDYQNKIQEVSHNSEKMSELIKKVQLLFVYSQDILGFVPHSSYVDIFKKDSKDNREEFLNNFWLTTELIENMIIEIEQISEEQRAELIFTYNLAGSSLRAERVHHIQGKNDIKDGERVAKKLDLSLQEINDTMFDFAQKIIERNSSEESSNYKLIDFVSSFSLSQFMILNSGRSMWINSLVREENFGETLKQFKAESGKTMDAFRVALPKSATEDYQFLKTSENIEISTALGELGILNDFLSNHKKNSEFWRDQEKYTEDQIKKAEYDSAIKFGFKDVTQKIHALLSNETILRHILEVHPQIALSTIAYQNIYLPDLMEKIETKKQEIVKYKQATENLQNAVSEQTIGSMADVMRNNIYANYIRMGQLYFSMLYTQTFQGFFESEDLGFFGDKQKFHEEQTQGLQNKLKSFYVLQFEDDFNNQKLASEMNSVLEITNESDKKVKAAVLMNKIQHAFDFRYVPLLQNSIEMNSEDYSVRMKKAIFEGLFTQEGDDLAINNSFFLESMSEYLGELMEISSFNEKHAIKRMQAKEYLGYKFDSNYNLVSLLSFDEDNASKIAIAEQAWRKYAVMDCTSAPESEVEECNLFEELMLTVMLRPITVRFPEPVQQKLKESFEENSINYMTQFPVYNDIFEFKWNKYLKNTQFIRSAEQFEQFESLINNCKTEEQYNVLLNAANRVYEGLQILILEKQNTQNHKIVQFWMKNMEQQIAMEDIQSANKIIGSQARILRRDERKSSVAKWSSFFEQFREDENLKYVSIFVKEVLNHEELQKLFALEGNPFKYIQENPQQILTFMSVKDFDNMKYTNLVDGKDKHDQKFEAKMGEEFAQNIFMKKWFFNQPIVSKQFPYLEVYKCKKGNNIDIKDNEYNNLFFKYFLKNLVKGLQFNFKSYKKGSFRSSKNFVDSQIAQPLHDINDGTDDINSLLNCLSESYTSYKGIERGERKDITPDRRSNILLNIDYNKIYTAEELTEENIFASEKTITDCKFFKIAPYVEYIIIDHHFKNMNTVRHSITPDGIINQIRMNNGKIVEKVTNMKKVTDAREKLEESQKDLVKEVAKKEKKYNAIVAEVSEDDQEILKGMKEEFETQEKEVEELRIAIVKWTPRFNKYKDEAEKIEAEYKTTPPQDKEILKELQKFSNKQQDNDDNGKFMNRHPDEKKVEEGQGDIEKKGETLLRYDQKLDEILQKVKEKRIADEKAAEEKRIADKKAADEKTAEEQRIADQKAAEEKAAEDKRIADKKAADEKAAEDKRIADKKAADEKAAEEKRIADKKAADEKAAEEKRIADKKAADEKAAEEKRIADKKAAEDKRVADKKAADDKAAEEKKIADKKAEDQRIADKQIADDKAAEEKRIADKKVEDQRIADKQIADDKAAQELADKQENDQAKLDLESAKEKLRKTIKIGNVSKKSSEQVVADKNDPKKLQSDEKEVQYIAEQIQNADKIIFQIKRIVYLVDEMVYPEEIDQIRKDIDTEKTDSDNNSTTTKTNVDKAQQQEENMNDERKKFDKKINQAGERLEENPQETEEIKKLIQALEDAEVKQSEDNKTFDSEKKTIKDTIDEASKQSDDSSKKVIDNRVEVEELVKKLIIHLVSTRTEDEDIKVRIVKEQEDARIVARKELDDRIAAKKEEDARIAKEQEDARIAQEEEDARIAQEKEDARIAQEEEDARIAAKKEEDARIAKQKEDARIAKEKEDARIAQEKEDARIAKEKEDARIAKEKEDAKIADDFQKAKKELDNAIEKAQKTFDKITDKSKKADDVLETFKKTDKSVPEKDIAEDSQSQTNTIIEDIDTLKPSKNDKKKIAQIKATQEEEVKKAEENAKKNADDHEKLVKKSDELKQLNDEADVVSQDNKVNRDDVITKCEKLVSEDLKKCIEDVKELTKKVTITGDVKKNKNNDTQVEELTPEDNSDITKKVQEEQKKAVDLLERLRKQREDEFNAEERRQQAILEKKILDLAELRKRLKADIVQIEKLDEEADNIRELSLVQKEKFTKSKLDAIVHEERFENKEKELEQLKSDFNLTEPVKESVDEFKQVTDLLEDDIKHKLVIVKKVIFDAMVAEGDYSIIEEEHTKIKKEQLELREIGQQNLNESFDEQVDIDKRYTNLERDIEATEYKMTRLQKLNLLRNFEESKEFGDVDIQKLRDLVQQAKHDLNLRIKLAEEAQIEQERVEEEERQQKVSDDKRIADEKKAAKEKAAREKKEAEEKAAREKREAEEKAQREKIAQDKKIAEEAARQKKIENDRRIAEELAQKKIEDDRIIAEEAAQKKIEDDRKIAQEAAKQKKIENDRRIAEEAAQKKIDDDRRIAEEAAQKKIDDDRRIAEEKAEAARQKKIEDDKREAELQLSIGNLDDLRKELIVEMDRVTQSGKKNEILSKSFTDKIAAHNKKVDNLENYVRKFDEVLQEKANIDQKQVDNGIQLEGQKELYDQYVRQGQNFQMFISEHRLHSLEQIQNSRDFHALHKSTKLRISNLGKQGGRYLKDSVLTQKPTHQEVDQKRQNLRDSIFNFKETSQGLDLTVEIENVTAVETNLITQTEARNQEYNKQVDDAIREQQKKREEEQRQREEAERKRIEQLRMIEKENNLIVARTVGAQGVDENILNNLLDLIEAGKITPETANIEDFLGENRQNFGNVSVKFAHVIPTGSPCDNSLTSQVQRLRILETKKMF